MCVGSRETFVSIIVHVPVNGCSRVVIVMQSYAVNKAAETPPPLGGSWNAPAPVPMSSKP